MNTHTDTRYGKRILAKNVEITNDTRISGCNNNDIVCGNSGSGKTGGYVIPNIQNIDGSLVVSDTKRQLEYRFKAELMAKGYNVYTIDFVNMEASCGYNPMEYIRRHPDGSYYEQDILSLSRLLCSQRLDGDEPIWEMSAASYIAFLIAYCLETESPEDRNLMRVSEIYREFIRPDSDLVFQEWASEHPDSFAAKKYSEIMANKVADRMHASIVGFVNVSLEPYSFQEAGHIFANQKNFDISELGSSKTVLFLNVSDTDRTFDQLVNTFYSQALQRLCADADASEDGRLPVPVRIIMDDFAAGTVIPDFDKTISVIRSRDISVSLILQSISQLESMYTPSASRTILNNCDHILYLGSQDIDTANYIAARAGKTPETVLYKPRDKAFLITFGEKARLVDKILPYSTVTAEEEKYAASPFL